MRGACNRFVLIAPKVLHMITADIAANPVCPNSMCNIRSAA